MIVIDACTVDPHRVGIPVDKAVRNVDDTCGSRVVHHVSAARPRSCRLSSTARNPFRASVDAAQRTSSTVSTDAKTTDETSYSMSDKGPNVSPVDSGDNAPADDMLIGSAS